MPTEVISLLSSSPPRPPTANQENAYIQCESPRNGIGTKRPASYQAHHESYEGYKGHRNYDDHDSLFLSDDFGTAGDPGASFHKKVRTSVDSSYRVGKQGDGVSPKKNKSAMIASSHREPLQPVNVRRWGNMVEDIEFSSSPIDPVSLKTTKKAAAILSDPFASPQRGYVPKSIARKSPSVDPFCSVPTSPSKNEQEPAKSRADLSTKGGRGAQRSSKAAFIDLSSDPIGSPPQPKQQSNLPNTRFKATWDPISSSAPSTHDIYDLLSSPPAAASTRRGLKTRATSIGSSSDSGDLPDLDAVDFSKTRATKQSYSTSSYTTAPTTNQTVRRAPKSTEEKERERKQKIEAREVDKERKRIEKVRAKEERALQKEERKALAEVNKLRTDKKVSAPEMIVDIPTSINSGLKVQVKALLDDLSVQHESWSSTVEHVVKWRRKVTSRFDEAMGFWVPTPMHIEDEVHVLVIVQAEEFIKFILGEEGQDLEAHVLRMQMEFPNNKVIYLIEGLAVWMRKNRNILNRQFASAVRNLGTNHEPGPSCQPRHGNNNQPQEYVDEDKIEDALLSLQVLHGMLVHHTSVPVETAQWVAVFTQHISTIPYRKARDASADAGFCMESGQVRTGENTKDTYIQMLQEIARVTAPIAYGIVAKYGSMPELISGLEEEGPLALAECRKGANKDGALTNRAIGQAISKRIYKIFLGRDPNSTDV